MTAACVSLLLRDRGWTPLPRVDRCPPVCRPVSEAEGFKSGLPAVSRYEQPFLRHEIYGGCGSRAWPWAMGPCRALPCVPSVNPSESSPAIGVPVRLSIRERGK